MAIHPLELRKCLGHFTTGVTVITCRGDDDAPHGATVNAFTAVSLEPPLVLVSLDRRSKVCGLVDSRPFTVNVLEAAQKDLALHFAGQPNQDVAWAADSDCGSPRLGGTLAHISCVPWQHYDGGDHVRAPRGWREHRGRHRSRSCARCWGTAGCACRSAPRCRWPTRRPRWSVPWRAPTAAPWCCWCSPNP